MTRMTQNSPEQIMAARKAQAEADTAAKTVVAKPTLPAIAGNGGAMTAAPQLQHYLDAIAPSVLRRIKFDKDGRFIVIDSGDVIGEDEDFVGIYDETWAGWLKFHGPNQPPTRVGGLIYKGGTVSSRESLGDTDPAAWELGLDGKPADPWLHQIALPLQNCTTKELFAFTTTSVTGRRAVGAFLKACTRLPPDVYPIVRLKVGGFPHRDSRVGWVKTPAIASVGRTPKDGAAKPDTSLAADLNDEIGF
jgi:hypothetical protein